MAAFSNSLPGFPRHNVVERTLDLAPDPSQSMRVRAYWGGPNRVAPPSPTNVIKISTSPPKAKASAEESDVFHIRGAGVYTGDKGPGERGWGLHVSYVQPLFFLQKGGPESEGARTFCTPLETRSVLDANPRRSRELRRCIHR